MLTRQLARADLNLLLTLEVLLEYRSVTEAARRLHLTQSAISKALGRLRQQFDDPLFHRASRGLVPTPFAERLRQPLHEWLETAATLFVHEDFDPATWAGEFKLVAHDYLRVALVPRLLSMLREEAPRVSVRVQSQFKGQLEGLAEGELDFVLNLEFSGLSAEFESETLYTDSPVILAGLRHPLRKKRWTPDDLMHYPRIALRMPDMDKFMMFQARGAMLSHRWPAAYETDNLIVALATIAQTDSLLPAGDLLTGLATRDLAFKPLPSVNAPPFKLAYCLVNHRRLQNSAPHQWLKRAIGRVFQTLHA